MNPLLSGCVGSRQRAEIFRRYFRPLEALTEQFPEPLLCVRELIQNAADAGAQKITVDVAYDGDRHLLRLSVTDDGRGMNSSDIEAYLTIGFSDKNKDIHRGRFGIELSPMHWE